MMLFTKRCLTGLFAVLGLSLLAFSAPVFAVASLQVMVTDGQQNELPGETISLFTEDGQQIQADDKKGAVTYFNDLPPGAYVVKSGDQILRTVNVSVTDTVKRISVTASVPAAYTPGLLAGGIGLSAVAGFGFLLSEDGAGAEGDPPSSARPDPSTTRPSPSTTGPGSSICEVSPSRCRPSPSTTRPASGAYGYDSRALAASTQALGDASGNISGLMARPDLESATRRRSLIPIATGSAFWLRGFGNRARYREQTGLRPEAGHLGIATGYDLRLNATQFGVLAGYGRGELRFEGTQRFRPGPSLFKGPFAGVYVRRDFAPFSVQVGLSGGTLKHESSRLVNDNLAPSGQARAEARTRSWWLAPEARVGLRLDAGLMQFEPSFTARYARQSIRGFTETGIRAPATVGQRKVELVETRLELKAGREVGPGRIALKAGWQYRDDLNSNQARVRLLGESQRVRLESGLGSSLYLGAEAEFELAPGLFLNLSGEAVSGSGYRNISGMASVYQAF